MGAVGTAPLRSLKKRLSAGRLFDVDNLQIYLLASTVINALCTKLHARVGCCVRCEFLVASPESAVLENQRGL